MTDYRFFEEDNNEAVTLTWRNLSVFASIPQRKFFSSDKYIQKRIIDNATGIVKAGDLVALMGPSGSGKSSLMSALANRTPNNIHVNGEIYINGVPIGNFMNKSSGFLQQEDIFVGALTVREHLRFMVWLKLGKNKRSSDVEKVVKDLLAKVDLTSSADKRIGLNQTETVLSGGEKKRLAFATEMISNPKLFFCDEPTTGLDSYSAQSIIRLMKSMTLQKRTILCTIHQPSSQTFEMFDNLILLMDGKIAFIGKSKEALNYFQEYGYICPMNYNPAEFFIRTLTSKASRRDIYKMCNEFIVSDYMKNIDSFIEEHIARDSQMIQRKMKNLTTGNNWSEPSWLTKTGWLVHRSFLQVMRDPSVQGMRIIQKLGIAFMAGLCFTQSNPGNQSGIQSIQGAVFLFVTENTFPGMYSIMSLFPQELPIFLREYRNGFYSSYQFYISKMVSMLPGLILDPFLFTVVFYWLAGLRATLHAFFMTSLMAILTMNVATACGSFFSNAFNSASLAMACLVPFDYMLMVTSGLFIKLNTLPNLITWFKYLSWFMYSNEVIMIAQWDGIRNISCEYTNPEIPCMSDGREVLESYSFSSSHLYRNILIMVALCVLFHLSACFFLWKKARINK